MTNSDFTIHRKRKGGIRLEDETNDTNNGSTVEVSVTGLTADSVKTSEELAREEEERKAIEEKNKADRLWSDFMSDVRPKSQTQKCSTSSSSVSIQLKLHKLTNLPLRGQ